MRRSPSNPTRNSHYDPLQCMSHTRVPSRDCYVIPPGHVEKLTRTCLERWRARSRRTEAAAERRSREFPPVGGRTKFPLPPEITRRVVITEVRQEVAGVDQLSSRSVGEGLARGVVMTARISADRYAKLLPALLLVLVVVNPSAQTTITPDKNSYSVADDVRLGQEAAAEAKKQLPMLNDDRVDAFVENVGAHLAAAIPSELRHAGFRYTFDVVNQKEINAFAVPGGPMFLNRGMIEAAKSEAEIAGVMAHEIAHVALRHGTAQATKGQKFQIGAIAGQILGAIVGGTAGSVISQGSQLGLGTYFMKYGREYERQADLLGAQIMARAGYDPRQMANMFKTIQAEGGGGGPEWLSSHPNPGNRYNAINAEAAKLRVANATTNTQEFASVKSRLTGMSPSPTAQENAQRQKSGGPVGTSGRTVARVEAPAAQYRRHTPAQFLNIAVPSNWNQVGGGQGGVTYAPEGGFFQGDNGGTAFTHGVQLGVM